MNLSDAWSDQAKKQAIQDAVLAERERCAKIAGEWDDTTEDTSVARIIAAEIRSCK